MKRLSIILCGALLGTAGVAGADDVAGREHVLKFAGCHSVTYYFHEDGEHDHLNPERPPALVTEEYSAITEEEPGRIVLQHATLDPDGLAIPHYHEIWTHGPGGWTQSVYGRELGGERELRTRCTAPWSINRWACDIGPSPRPFRDSGAPFGFMRDDYEQLFRRSVILVTPEGWVHSQDNRKLTLDGDLVAHELGYIIADKHDQETCDQMVTDRSLLDAVE